VRWQTSKIKKQKPDKKLPDEQSFVPGSVISLSFRICRHNVSAKWFSFCLAD